MRTSSAIAAVTALAAGLAAAVAVLVSPLPAAAADANLVPIQPARLLDTRRCTQCVTVDGNFAGVGALATGATLTLDVGGRGGVDADAVAVLLNVTAVAPVGPGYLTVFPCTAERPHASNVNYVAGDVAANAVLAKLSPAGQVCIYAKAGTDVVVDVSGYVPPAGAPVPIGPARLLETRLGAGDVTVDHLHEHVGRLGAGQTVEFQVWGRGQAGDSVPGNAQAVYLNVTAIAPDGPGFLTVYPCSATVPAVSNVNYTAGDVAPNSVLATVSPRGTVCIFTKAAVDVIADVNGYLPPGGNRVAISPARCADTRTTAEGGNTFDGLFLGHGRLPAGGTYAVTIAGRCNVGGDASAAYVNVTAVNPSADGFLTVWPCDQPRPTASNVNYTPGAVQPNSVLAKISLDGSGQICIFSKAATHVIVDANGYVPAVGLAGIVELGVGSGYSCARNTDGLVRCVGDHVTIGAGPRELGASANPTPVLGVTGAAGLDVDNGHACAVLVDGSARCWGHNDDGQLGDGTTLGEPGLGYVARQTPVQPPITGVLDIAVGGAWNGHTCAIVEAGVRDAVRCWGDNYFGQLGRSTAPATESAVPIDVTLPGAASPVEIEAGHAGTCVRMSDATVHCWGQVLVGQPTPKLIALSGAAVDVSVGTSACAVTVAGTVDCWGPGLRGQLGDGNEVSSFVPVQAAGVAGAASVSVGVESACATLATGTAMCWGANTYGQLGRGTSSDKEPLPAPVTIVAGHVAHTVTNMGSTCVLLVDQTARCWGFNLAGQLGVRVNGDSAGPVRWGAGALAATSL